MYYYIENLNMANISLCFILVNYLSHLQKQTTCWPFVHLIEKLPEICFLIHIQDHLGFSLKHKIFLAPILVFHFNVLQ